MSSSTRQHPTTEEEEEEDKNEDDGSSSKPRAKRNPPRSRRVNDVDYTEQHDGDDDSDGSIKPRAKKRPRKKKANDMSKRKSRSDPEAAVAAVGGGDDDRPASLLHSIDLLNAKTTPKIVAEALLALLPQGATKHDAAAKTLTKAFPLFKAELEARTSALTRKTESEGTRLPIAFHFHMAGAANDGEEDGGTSVVINVPEECFINMLSFLNGKEVVNVSTVSKVWLSISRKPEVWSRLDRKSGLSNKSKKLNMTLLLALLSRPQFANLKYLQMPNKCKMGKNSLRSISRACPNLETFDMGYAGWGGRGSDSDLLNAAEIFSNLTGLHFCMWSITNNGIMSAVRMMGTQLLDLRIQNYRLGGKCLSDEVVGVIAEFCPNLKHFTYKTMNNGGVVARDLSASSITGLIRKCRQLEVLELIGAQTISRDDFAAILIMLEHEDNQQHALRSIVLRGYPFVIGDKPFTITELRI